MVPTSSSQELNMPKANQVTKGSNRRAFLKTAPAVAAAAAITAPASARAQGTAADKPVKKVHWNDGKRPEKVVHPELAQQPMVQVSDTAS
jgi:hypothetical protein